MRQRRIRKVRRLIDGTRHLSVLLSHNWWMLLLAVVVVMSRQMDQVNMRMMLLLFFMRVVLPQFLHFFHERVRLFCINFFVQLSIDFRDFEGA